MKDTAQSFYYTSADHLEYLNIDILINQNENGIIMMDGSVKNKKSLGAPSVEKVRIDGTNGKPSFRIDRFC